MKKYLGIDIGTTAIKALVVNEAGSVLDMFSKSLRLNAPKPAWAEQDPEDWFSGTMKLLEKISCRHDINAMSFSGQMHSLVSLDNNDKVIRPAILWCDQRTTAECKEATKILGGEKRVIERIGNPILEGFTLPKILWLKKNEPLKFEKMSSFLLAKDYVIYRLTGVKGIEWSDASGTAAYNVKTREWDKELIKELDLPETLFPKIFSSKSIRGFLKDSILKELGWKKVPVISGGADNASAALGIGVARTGDTMVSIGTSGTVLTVTDSNKPDESGKIHYFNHVLPEKSYFMGVMLSAAHSANWFKDEFFEGRSWKEIEEMITNSVPGSRGLIFLPYLNGERTPHRNPNARGVLFGLSSVNNNSDVMRSVIEGITFGLKDSFELIKEKTEVGRVRVVGGGAKNPVWCKILASIFEYPVEVPKMDEGGVYGAAMLSAMGDGMDLSDVLSWIKVDRVVEPDVESAEIYRKIYPEFTELYNDLRERFDSVLDMFSY
ncbi:MAG: xylulokinase [Thermotogota bacterium]|nr:xylulokinase [Thermotogota bacterium]